MGLSATLPARSWWYASTREPRAQGRLPSCKERIDKRPDGGQSQPFGPG